MSQNNSNKMYHLKKPVVLPNIIDLSNSMYEIKHPYQHKLSEDIGYTYYNDNYQELKKKSNRQLELITTDSGGEYFQSICGLDKRQKDVLEKLKHLKLKLERFAEKTSAIKANKNPEKIELESNLEKEKSLISVIDNLKAQLYEAKYNEQDKVQSQDNLLCQLHKLKELTEGITCKSKSVQPSFVHETDLNAQKENIVDVIDALRTLLVSEIVSDEVNGDNNEVLLNQLGLLKRLLGAHKKDNVESFESENIIQIIDNLKYLLRTDISSLQSKENSSNINDYHFGVLLLVDELKGELNVLLSNIINLSVESLELLLCTCDKKNDIIHDLVITANPQNPPYSLIVLRNLLKQYGLNVLLTCCIHSSIGEVDLEICRLFNDESNKPRSSYDLGFTILWKNQSMASLMVSPVSQSTIIGELNILRYISRLLPIESPLNYESKKSCSDITEVDYWLDVIQNKLLNGNNKEKHSFLQQLNVKLGSSGWIDGNSCSISDIFAWSVILQLNMKEKLMDHIKIWFKNIQNISGIDNKNIHNKKKEDKSFIDRNGLELYLKNLGIKFQVRDHPEVFTVDAMMKYLTDFPGLHMKNLFLKDKKNNLYILVARHDAKVEMKDVSKQTGIKDLRFGDEKIMYDILGINQGCVTLFALINDKHNEVKLLLDSEALNFDHPFINFHPMTNSSTLGISPKDLQIFLKNIEHEPIFLLNF